MKKLLLMFCLAAGVLPGTVPLNAQSMEGAEKLGWQIGSQAYTFRAFTLEETLDKLNELGLKYVELYPGQEVGAGIEGTTAYEMSAGKRAQLKQLLASKNIQPVCYGVAGGKTRKDWEQLFAFAEDLGIGVITSEPSFDQLDIVEELCEKHQIKLAIHNHPQPSLYWNPDVVLAQIQDRSPLIGACADIGHWARSGLDPVACLQKLKGRVISFHFKDVNDFGVKKAHDVPWGTGCSNIAGVMHEMKRQGFKGPISVEYEHNPEDNMPEIRESLEYFRRVTNALESR